MKELHAKIGQQALEIKFISYIRRARQTGRAERKALMDRAHELPIKRQAQLLGLSRSSVYYKPSGPPASDLRLMRREILPHVSAPKSRGPRVKVT